MTTTSAIGVVPSSSGVRRMSAPPAQQVTTFADKKGSYRLRPILPGDYLVAAFDAPITLEADAPLLSSLARTATRVTVTPGDVRTIALPLGKLR